MIKVAKPNIVLMILLVFMAAFVLGGCNTSSSEPVQDGGDDANNSDSEQQTEGDSTEVQGPEPLESEVKLKIGFPTQGASMLPLWVAKDGGFFEKSGIDAELVYIAGTPKVQEVLVAV